MNPDQHVAGAWNRIGHLFRLEGLRTAERTNYYREHAALSVPACSSVH